MGWGDEKGVVRSSVRDRNAVALVVVGSIGAATFSSAPTKSVMFDQK